MNWDIINVNQDLLKGNIMACPYYKFIGYGIDQNLIHMLIFNMEFFLLIVNPV